MPLPPLLAFGWTSLPMLGWLAVAAAPILIHLLSRRRYREQPWAAMQFLLAAMRESRRRLRIEQWLLLAVRTLVIVLVVLAVAGPFFESAGSLFAPGGVRTHRVLVLDASYSMGYKPDRQSRFDQAKELAARIVRASPQGDGFSLVLMGRPPRAVVETAALAPAEFLRELDAVRRTDGTADLAATLATVEAVLRQTRRERPGLEREEVYFLTDLCRVGWMSPSAGASGGGEALRRARQFSRQARLAVIDLGQPEADNLAVTRLAGAGAYTTLASAAEFEVALHNFGRQGRTGQSVELVVDGQRVARQAVDLPAGRSRLVRFVHRFDSPGEHTIRARLADDRLPVDNHRWLVLPVRRAVDVLCVDGRPGGGFGGAAAYLDVALSPREDDRIASVHSTTVPESALVETDLARYECVFLCDVAQLTPTEARVLGDYVRAGGGLVVFLGERVMADAYNRELFERQSLLPARLESVVENTAEGLDPLDYAHPIVEPFRGREKAGLLTTPIDKYVKLALPPDTTARVALAMRSGDPLVVEQAVGRGRVVLVATSADTSWTAMPLWPSYVPIVQEILAYAVAGRLAQHNVHVGDPLGGTVPTSSADDAGRIVLPDGRDEALPVAVDAEGRRRWSLAAADAAGVYSIRFGATESRFAVNVGTVESDLDKLSEQQLREDVWPGVTFDYQTTWESSDRPAAPPMAHRGGLVRWLLWAALGLLVGETILARGFGHHGAMTSGFGTTDEHG